MTVAVENPAPDIFEGCGNGTLHTYVVRVPENWNADSGDRHIPVCLNEVDWQAIFFKRLHCPERDAYVPGEDTNDWLNRNRRLFERSIPDYPMLGRIFDMYEDYTFTPNEAALLRDECLRAKASSSEPSADVALRKIIYCCNIASAENRHLVFSGD
jgi:hypothetical protein